MKLITDITHLDFVTKYFCDNQFETFTWSFSARMKVCIFKQAKAVQMYVFLQLSAFLW